ncbi:YqaA family protein [Testudinibacter sp. P80/BLE/0925]|uniref:YqaA family protein n=1 Tax=Testudinibacter sp. TW-1 TaxID=3417757 RepID=UPI003D36B0BE
MLADWLLTVLPDWALQNQWLLMFASAFLSATLLPGNSEVVFSGLLLLQSFSQPSEIFWLWLAATLGNALGGMTSYAIGRMVAVPEWQQLNRRQRQGLRLFARYGSLSLLFSWLPFIGDLLCIAAGWLRLHWITALLLITLGKGLRYLLLIGLSAF